jgi:methylated-DNA-[protein]-cysteine S-methyltransferase
MTIQEVLLLYSTWDSPIGKLLAVGDGRSIRGLHMQEGRRRIGVQPGWSGDDGAFGDLRAQLDEYFAGRRRSFDLPVDLAGSPFQRRVWEALRAIPYGETISYGELARRVHPSASPRAVGTANGRNPVCVIVPCHRVIGADGSLTGYAGGLERKRLLLDLESGVLPLV